MNPIDVQEFIKQYIERDLAKFAKEKYGEPKDFGVPESEIEAYLQAAGRGDVLTVRAFLDNGMPVDATKKLHPDSTALIYAGNNPVMVRILIAAGANVNGPIPEPGGLTPLVNAVTDGNAEITQILLEAGADPNFRSMFAGRRKIKAPIDFARESRRKAIIELLTKAGAGDGPCEFAFAAVKQFEAEAKRPEYAEVLNRLAGICGHSPRRWTKAKGAFSFEMANFGVLAALRGENWVPHPHGMNPRVDTPRRERHIDMLQDEVRSAGFCLVLSDSMGDFGPAKLRLFPTSDKFAVVAATKVSGGNRGHTTRDLIQWLMNFDRENPFVLTGCGSGFSGFITGKFQQPLQNARAWADRMCEMCPDFETTGDDLVREMETSRTFFLGWS